MIDLTGTKWREFYSVSVWPDTWERIVGPYTLKVEIVGLDDDDCGWMVTRDDKFVATGRTWSPATAKRAAIAAMRRVDTLAAEPVKGGKGEG